MPHPPLDHGSAAAFIDRSMTTLMAAPDSKANTWWWYCACAEVGPVR